MDLKVKTVHGIFVNTIWSKDKKNLKLTEAEKLVLLMEMKSSDPDRIKRARLKIFDAHARLAVKIITRYTAKFPKRYHEEFVSEAMIALIEGIDKLCDLKHNNQTGYLIVKIHGHMLNYIRKTFKRIDYYTAAKDDYTFDNTINELETIETCDKLVKTSLERVILDLKLQDYEDVEIAEIMSVSKQYIGEIKNKFKNRYNRL